MTVWEFRNADVNRYALWTNADVVDLDDGLFDIGGVALNWPRRPRLTAFVVPRTRKAKPQADIGALQPGAVLLNARAHDALSAFLGAFGQLLEVDCDGRPGWFYNVTTVIDALDGDNSEYRASGAVAREAFVAGRIPVEPVVFKVPQTATVKLYVNDAARQVIEARIAAAGLTGAEFVVPGSR